MAPRTFTEINELKITKDDFIDHSSIQVRVSRLTTVLNPKPEKRGEVLHVGAVLIDEQGDYVYAKIAPRLFNERYNSLLVDGQVHIIRRFKVLANPEEYRIVSDSKIMIQFIHNTYVKAVEKDITTIPKHRFDFLKFHNIDSRRGITSVLTDLCGMVVDVRESRNYFALEIEDDRAKRVRVALWDRYISQYKEQTKTLKDNQPIIVTITSLLVRKYNESSSISTTTSSSLYINLDIPEVDILRELWREKKGQTKTITPSIQNVTTMDIKSILQHCSREYQQDLICYCKANVKNIIEDTSWNYRSCMTCTTRPQYDVSIFFCSKCQKECETQTTRYCIELRVQDTENNTIFVVFDKEAKKILGQDAVSLLDSLKTEDEDDVDDEEIPSLLYDTFVGREFLFQIKVTQANHVSKRKSFHIMNILDTRENEEDGSPSTQYGAHKEADSVVELDEINIQQPNSTKRANINKVKDQRPGKKHKMNNKN